MRHSLGFRATTMERRLLRQAAQLRELTVAEFLRASALAAADRVVVVEAGLREGVDAARARPLQTAATQGD